MNSFLIRGFATLALVLTLAACGSSGGGGGASVQPNNPFSNVELQGFAAPSSAYPNFQVVTINPAAMTITFAFPIAAPITTAIFSVPVTQIPGATITIQPDANNNWSASLTMPLKDLYSGISYQDPATLPNGQPLPGLAAVGLGTLPMLLVTVPLNNTTNFSFYLYGSRQALAIFYPTPHTTIPATIIWQILSKKNNILGHIGLVGTLGTFAGGLYGDYLIPATLQGPGPTPTPVPTATPNPTPVPTPVPTPTPTPTPNPTPVPTPIPTPTFY